MIKSLSYFLICSLSCTLMCSELKLFDVGQGNCTVVRHPEHGTLLVDAGSSSLPKGRSKYQIIKSILTYTCIDDKPITIVVSQSKLKRL